MLASGRRNGKPDAELRTSRNRFHVNLSVVAANQFENDVQAEARSGANRLCGEEWIKDAIANFFRDSRAVIDNADHNVSAFSHRTCLDVPVLCDGIQRVV